MSYWKLFVSGSFQDVDSRTVIQPDRIETRMKVERQGLSYSLEVTIVSLSAFDQMALWTLKEQE